MIKENWISVKDLLPGENLRDILCFFTDMNTRIYNSQDIKITGIFRFEDGKGGYFEAQVTHWSIIVPPEEE